MQLRNVVPQSSGHPSQIDETGVCSQPPMLIPASSSSATQRRAGWLDAALFFCLTAFALCAPLATKGAVTAFRAALLVWLVKILVDGRKRGITDLTIAVLIGQNLKSLRQVKILVGLLFVACMASLAITAWQYTVGIGVELMAD